jgi:predicted transcriptional regulator
LRGLKGATSEDRLSFRTVMEPLPATHRRTSVSPDFELAVERGKIQRNISRSMTTLQNSVAL